MGLQIRLSGQVRDQIRGVHGEVKDLGGRIERVRDELNGRIDQVSSELKDVRGEVTLIKGHLSAALALGLSKTVETP
ncbi:MAG: hypothetical protein F4Z75_09525 [Synechococcus sp. SB0668_bin_15]|nr:hypothetical protein [Synechococcus sp. SB0668_bin_15]MYC48723.1 hypothetical protein [Synechococcus sp. SB0662_bin_14]MYG47041.1 hypothetical protein [Synechococcus sp. SB0675_bin_6]MYJ59991.1 hypothetical protein [Synechococcus sp. SB0672_bin_6]MYK91997.1 hypothetical protein [Synechococcus sp. SB0669_bin_8]